MMEAALRKHLYSGLEGGYDKNPFGATSVLRESMTLAKVDVMLKLDYLHSRYLLYVFKHLLLHRSKSTTTSTTSPKGFT